MQNYSKSIIRSKTLFTENYFEFKKKVHARESYKEYVYQIWCKSDE